jgi:hypothetical protein
MGYKKADMVYKDYKESARADHDNPNYRGGTDHKEINKTELFEVVPFIENYAHVEISASPAVSIYQKIEKLLRKAPAKSTHKEAREWIKKNWNTI